MNVKPSVHRADNASAEPDGPRPDCGLRRPQNGSHPYPDPRRESPVWGELVLTWTRSIGKNIPQILSDPEAPSLRRAGRASPPSAQLEIRSRAHRHGQGETPLSSSSIRTGFVSASTKPFSMEPTPSIPAPQLFDLRGQNVLLTGGTRGTPRNAGAADAGTECTVD